VIQSFASTIYTPAADLAAQLIGIPRTRPADVLMLAIAGQESAWQHRAQIGGPARGFWQFERGGGVVGVLSHRASAEKARSLCTALRIEADAATVYDALRWNDVLALGFARLLLWTDPRPMPTDASNGWDCYLRNWRPGKPHGATWQSRWDAATSIV